MTSEDNRFGLAIAIAPLAAPAIFFGMLVATSGQFSMTILSIGLVTSLVSYCGFFLVGIPTIYFLRKIDMLRLWSLCIAGAIGGVIVGVVIDVGLGGKYAIQSLWGGEIENLVSYAILGLAVATTFGLAARIPIK